MPTQPVADKLSAAAVAVAGPYDGAAPQQSAAATPASSNEEQLLAVQQHEHSRPAAEVGGTEVETWLAWSIVALAFTTDGLCLGARSFFAVVLQHWEAEFGWSRSYVSGAMSLVHVCNGLATPFAGHKALG